VAVIGGGLAGLSAAVRAAAGGASVICFEGAPLYGGLVANVGRLDDYPAPGAIAGAALADQLLERARELEVALVQAQVSSLKRAGEGHSIVAGPGTYPSRAVIIASGARLKQLGVPGEAELAGRGVSQCDWCDGGLYRGKRVAVVGGGDAALQAALHLAEMCDVVTVIARGPSLRARRSYVLRAADQPKIEFVWETVVERVVGDGGGVTGLQLRNAADGASSELECAAAFIFAGLAPNLEFAPAALHRDERGYAVTDADYRASVPGIFVVGAARSGNGGSLLSAMGEASSAAAIAAAEAQSER
jgi:thioredoxin reductase (NADPH)